jgi:general secretion pathway protein A
MNPNLFTREFPANMKMSLGFIDEAVDGIYGAIKHKMCASLIAPAGCGKTVILRAITEKLGTGRYSVGYIKVSDLSARDMCREISNVVGAKSSGMYHSLVRNLNEYFSHEYHENSLRPVIMIDDAHEIRPKTLAILKTLTNYKMDSSLIVSFVLVGQPPLREILSRESLRDIAGRIFHHVELRLLSKDETTAYLKHRCDMAAKRIFPFDEGACIAIYEITHGNMRAIDHLALKSLDIAAGKNTETVDESIIVAARKFLWQ